MGKGGGGGGGARHAPALGKRLHPPQRRKLWNIEYRRGRSIHPGKRFIFFFLSFVVFFV